MVYQVKPVLWYAVSYGVLCPMMYCVLWCTVSYGVRTASYGVLCPLDSRPGFQSSLNRDGLFHVGALRTISLSFTRLTAQGQSDPSELLPVYCVL